jgi:hypothetical protein
MSQFTKPFVGMLIGKNKWAVYNEFEYHVGCYPSEEVIKIPQGFRTNFLSIPRIFWPIISPIDTHAKAAVVHDYCYSVGYESKKRSDDIFREALDVLGVKKWKIFCMYWALRSFGWIAWWRCRIRGY